MLDQALDVLSDFLDKMDGRKYVRLNFFTRELSADSVAIENGSEIQDKVDPLVNAEWPRETNLRSAFDDILSVSEDPLRVDRAKFFIVVSDLAHDVSSLDPNKDTDEADIRDFSEYIGGNKERFAKAFDKGSVLVLIMLPAGPRDERRQFGVYTEIIKTINPAKPISIGYGHDKALEMIQALANGEVRLSAEKVEEGFKVKILRSCLDNKMELRDLVVRWKRRSDEKEGQDQVEVPCPGGGSQECLVKFSDLGILKPRIGRCEPLDIQAVNNGRDSRQVSGVLVNPVFWGSCLNIKQAHVSIKNAPDPLLIGSPKVEWSAAVLGQLYGENNTVKVSLRLGADVLAHQDIPEKEFAAQFLSANASEEQLVGGVMNRDAAKSLCGHATGDKEYRGSDLVFSIAVYSVGGQGSPLAGDRLFFVRDKDDDGEERMHSLWEHVSIPVLCLLGVVVFATYWVARPTLGLVEETLAVVGVVLVALFFAIHDMTRMGEWLEGIFESRWASILAISLGVAIWGLLAVLVEMGVFEERKSDEGLLLDVRWLPLSRRLSKRRWRHRWSYSLITGICLLYIGLVIWAPRKSECEFRSVDSVAYLEGRDKP